MVLQSTRKREGEPVLVLVAVRINQEGHLSAGLVFARGSLDNGIYEMTSASGGKRFWYIRLTDDAVDLPRDGWAANVTMEVVNDPKEQQRAYGAEEPHPLRRETEEQPQDGGE